MVQDDQQVDVKDEISNIRIEKGSDGMQEEGDDGENQ
jgi:hypothetical protein